MLRLSFPRLLNGPNAYLPGTGSRGKWEIFHPPVRRELDKNRGKLASLAKANLSRFGRYVPRNYVLQTQSEALRSGEYLGPDWPYNLLGMPMWQSRRYNVSYHALPANESTSCGVMHHAHRDHWTVQWHENGRHRIKIFRAQYCFHRAKYAAEAFRKSLEATGRIDNVRTVRQQKMLDAAKKEERLLR